MRRTIRARATTRAVVLMALAFLLAAIALVVLLRQSIMLAVGGPALVLLVSAITWWVAGRTRVPAAAIRREVAALHSPLDAIRAELDVAARHPDTAAWPDIVDRLSAASRRVERLVEDLLVLATAEEEPSPQRAEVDLDDVVIEQLRSRAPRTDVTVDSHAVDAARVWGNREQLERVVINLVDNAVRHAATKVTVELHAADGTARLIVADDGPGISLRDRRRIFERFTRIDDDGQDRPDDGAGLRLAIVRQIVENHGGTIALDEAAGGARFFVSLPTEEPDRHEPAE